MSLPIVTLSVGIAGSDSITKSALILWINYGPGQRSRIRRTNSKDHVRY